MKKLLGLALSIALVSCTCLSQIPPQVLYVDNNCEAFLPDYTTQVVVTDNCPEGIVINQTPKAGTALTVSNPSVDVEIIAIDAFGNISDKLIISVTLTDTIAPILSWPIGQINMKESDVINLYNNWIAAVKVHGAAKWIYDQTWTNGYAFADTANILEGLKTFTHSITLTDEEYSEYLSIKQNK